MVRTMTPDNIPNESPNLGDSSSNTHPSTTNIHPNTNAHQGMKAGNTMSDISTFTSDGMIGTGGNARRELPGSIDPTTDVNTAMEMAGLNFTVDAAPLSAWTPEFEHIDLGGIRAVYKTGNEPIKQLGKPIGPATPFEQPEVLGEFAKIVLTEIPGSYIGAGGVFGENGCRAFIQPVMPNPLCLTNDHEVFSTFPIMTGWGGTSKLVIMGSNVVPNCTNQFPSMLRDSVKVIALKHSGNFLQKLQDARTALRVQLESTRLWDIEMQRLFDTPFPSITPMVDHVLGDRPDEFVPTDDGGERRNRAYTNWENKRQAIRAEWDQDFNTDIQGTAFGAVMAVQGAFQHRPWSNTVTASTQMLALADNNMPEARRAFALVAQG